MFDYLRDINDCENDDEPNIEYSDFLSNAEIEMSDAILNSTIGDEEILEAVKKLKNNKAAGYDEVLNEQFLYFYLYITSCLILFLTMVLFLMNGL